MKKLSVTSIAALIVVAIATLGTIAIYMFVYLPYRTSYYVAPFTARPDITRDIAVTFRASTTQEQISAIASTVRATIDPIPMTLGTLTFHFSWITDSSDTAEVMKLLNRFPEVSSTAPEDSFLQ